MSDYTEREVLVTWRDEPEIEFYTLVAITPAWTELEADEDVFFYFSDEDEYLEALKNGTDEFTIRELENAY